MAQDLYKVHVYIMMRVDRLMHIIMVMVLGCIKLFYIHCIMIFGIISGILF